MRIKKRVFEYITVFMAIFFMGLIISAPKVCSQGAKYGLIICARVLIPSLFPFAVPVLFLINTELFNNSKHKLDLVYFLSLLGGYPIGAKIIAEISSKRIISKDTASKMIIYCINAGPAFIVLAVGKGILNNIKIGYILLFSHIISSVILWLILRPKTIIKGSYNKSVSPTENLVQSIYNASNATISICAFVVFFSVINEYLRMFGAQKLLLITEVTTASTTTDNIFIISFLLGFAGISIWAQIFHILECIPVSLIKFLSVRIIHGVLSATITYLVCKYLKIGIKTLSNGIVFKQATLFSDTVLSISIFIMAILLVINIKSKKYCGNIIKDMI